MANCKFIHDREGCIGCGACASLNPEDWKMSSEDGKANLIESKDIGGQFEKDFEEKNLKTNKEVAESCPVNVIHIEKDNEKII